MSLDCHKTDESSQGESMEKLELKLSATLYRKLCDKSKREGVTVNELASELLAEGLVLRAWEIMEGKMAMKQPSQSNMSQGTGKQGHKNFGRARHGYSNQNFQGNNKNSLLQQNNRRNNKFNNRSCDDNANFLEYVRSQEKKKPW